MGITEIAILPIQKGKAVGDTTTADGQLHADLVKDLVAKPGCQRCYWGRSVEDPSLLCWFVDWDNRESHQKFIDSDAYGIFVERLTALLAGDPKVYHVQFDPYPPRAALNGTTSPATEIVHMYFPNSYSAQDKEKVVHDIKAFIAVLEREAGTAYRASTGGWVEEEVHVPGTTEKATAYVLLIGWTSVEAHMSFRETKAFADNAQLLLGAKDLKKVEVMHASLTETPRTSSLL